MDINILDARLDTTLEPINIGINRGTIAAIGTDDLPPSDLTIDAGGAMISPAFIDPHFHLENALLMEIANASGTLREAISLYAEIKRNARPPDIVARSTRALHEAISHGTLWLRNHVDIDQVAQLHLLEAIVEVRRRFQDVIDIQIVAFPQMGLAENPEAVDLMWKALDNGADLVGGMPHGERDMDAAARHIEIAFEIAKEHDVDVDMHIDETDDPYWHTLELLADKTIEENYQGRVTAGHCCAMAAWDDKLAARVIEKVHAADVHIITNTPVNLLLQGRHDRQPIRRGITRVKELLEAGITVSSGQDDLMNMFYPFGQMDMLEVVSFVAHAAHLSSPAEIQTAFDMPRYAAAHVLRLPEYGVREGIPARLVLMDADSALDAVRRRGDRRYVIRGSEVLAKTQRQTTLASSVPV